MAPTRGDQKGSGPDYSRAPPATPRKDTKIVVMGDANADWRWVEVAYFPEISGSCEPRSYRDTKIVATEAAGFLKKPTPTQRSHRQRLTERRSDGSYLSTGEVIGLRYLPDC